MQKKTTSREEEKELLKDRLRTKMKLRSKGTALAEKKDPSKNATKLKRTVSMNWSHYDESINSYKGVRVGQDLASERTFKISKLATKKDLIAEGKELFFS